MKGFLSSRLDVSDYSRFLERELCWHDGFATHCSSGTQRQCPKCRAKWNFSGRRTHLGLLLEYCKEARAGDAAMVAGASRNTAQTTFRKFDRRVTALVQRMHSLGGIAVATEALTLRDLEFLRKHPGKRSSAEAVSRRIFFHGLNIDERVSHLIEPDLKEAIGFCLGRLPAVLRKSWRTPSSILERRRQLTDREWIAYTLTSIHIF